MTAPSSIFTTLRYDKALLRVPDTQIAHAGWNYRTRSPFYMLDYHRDRLLDAARHWNWAPAVDMLASDKSLETLSKRAEEFIGPSESPPLRFKITINCNGQMTFEKHVIEARSLESLFPASLPRPQSNEEEQQPAKDPRYDLLVDSEGTARSEYTHFKTSKRDMYDQARQRADLTPGKLQEVLIISRTDGFVMEASLTTPYFWRDEKWVTPTISLEFTQSNGSGGQNGTSRRWALERGIAVEKLVPVKTLVNGEECWISNGARGFHVATLRMLDTKQY